MKRKSFIGAVAAVALLVAFAGTSQASGFGPTHKATDIVEHWGPAETGALPSSDMSSRSAEPGAEYRTYNAFDTVQHWGPVEVGALPGQETKGRIVQEEIVIGPSEMGKPTAE